MFEQIVFNAFAHRFPSDKAGFVPTHGDCWRNMQFDHQEDDPNEAGISEEEKARRTKHLDEVWWPAVLEKVADEKARLESEHGETFTQHWERTISQPPEPPHGTSVV